MTFPLFLLDPPRRRSNMFFELFGKSLLPYVPSEAISCMLLGAGLCFTMVYVATLAAILACHIDDL